MGKLGLARVIIYPPMAAISHFVMAQFLLNQKTAVALTQQNPILSIQAPAWLISNDYPEHVLW